MHFLRQLAKLAVKVGKSLLVITFGDQDQQSTQFAEMNLTIIVSIVQISSNLIHVMLFYYVCKRL